MSKALGIFLLILILVGFFNKGMLIASANNFIYQSPCDTPITYRLGTIDPKFGITSDEFLGDIKDAGDIWSRAEAKKLYLFDPKGEVTINLVYDQRQFLNSQINQLNTDVKNQQQALDPKIAEYKAKTAAFQARVAQLNKDIEYWNGKGGAPQDEYDKLRSRQLSLRNEASILRTEAQNLNQSTEQFNSEVGQLHQTIDNFNQQLQFKPEEGEYIVDKGIQKINIYFNNSRPELIHTLAHELGHARGINHNNDQASIMFPQTTQAITLSPVDLSELKTVCKKRSIIMIGIEKFALIVNNVRFRFAHK